MGRKQIHPLRAFREAQKLTQVDAAKKFRVSQSEWSRLERGIGRPNPKLTKKLIAETGASLEVLMGVAS